MNALSVKTPSVSGKTAATSLEEGGFVRKGATAPLKRKPRNVPHGERECIHCTFHHPERPKRPCSPFGQCENKAKDCSLYIDNPESWEE